VKYVASARVSVSRVPSGRRLGTQATTWLVLGVGRLQDREAAHQSVIHGHERARVVKLSAVVGRTEHSDQLATAEELVSILNNLVSSTNQVDIVLLEELFDHSFSKSV